MNKVMQRVIMTNITDLQMMLCACEKERVVTGDGAKYKEAVFHILYSACTNSQVEIVAALLRDERVRAIVNEKCKTGTESFALSRASADGNLEIVRLLIEAGADCNATLKDGATALFVASQAGHCLVVDELIRAGANIDAQRDDGTTPICIASAFGHSVTVARLIDAGADLNKTDLLGGSPIFVAYCNNHLHVVAQLLRAGASCDGETKDGYTILGQACLRCDCTFVRCFIRAGAKVNYIPINGSSPLTEACVCGFTNIVSILIEEGANVNIKSTCGNTPLVDACITNNVEIAKMLIEAGADKDQRIENGWTPLCIASSNGRIELARVLIKVGPPLKSLDVAFRGSTALHFACVKMCVEIVRLLVEEGANIEVKDASGHTPLHVVCAERNLSQNAEEIVRILLRAGADVNSTDKDGRTPLVCASLGHNANIIKWLLNAGADTFCIFKGDLRFPFSIACGEGPVDVLRAFLVHEQNTKTGFDVRKYVNSHHKCRTTPIYEASTHGCVDVAQFLIDLGADVNKPDATMNRFTPLMTASENGHRQVVSLLLQNGADVNKESFGGMTALGYSFRRKNNFEVIETLLHAGAKISARELTELFINRVNYIMPKFCAFCAGTHERRGEESPVRLLAGFPQITAFICNQSLDPQLQHSGTCVKLP